MNGQLENSLSCYCTYPRNCIQIHSRPFAHPLQAVHSWHAVKSDFNGDNETPMTFNKCFQTIRSFNKREISTGIDQNFPALYCTSTVFHITQ